MVLFLELGAWTEQKRAELSTNVHLPLLHDCVCDVTSYGQLLLPLFCYHDGLSLKTVSQRKPFPLKLLLTGCFITVTGGETETYAVSVSLSPYLKALNAPST